MNHLLFNANTTYDFQTTLSRILLGSSLKLSSENSRPLMYIDGRCHRPAIVRILHYFTQRHQTPMSAFQFCFQQHPPSLTEIWASFQVIAAGVQICRVHLPPSGRKQWCTARLCTPPTSNIALQHSSVELDCIRVFSYTMLYICKSVRAPCVIHK